MTAPHIVRGLAEAPKLHEEVQAALAAAARPQGAML